jgi:methylisocitrate lyase
MSGTENSGAERIRALVGEGRPLVMGGVFDGLTTRLADRAGFEILFAGGFSVAATVLGEPDFGYLTQTEMATTAQRLCRLTDKPILIDADTGYGNPLNVLRTVELWHSAGAAGLFLEDQVWPKRCGHMRDKQVVARDEWAAKLRAVLSARPDRDLFLVARTDARAVLGLTEAVERGKIARDLGADAVFVEAPESVAELETIARAIPGAKVANMVEGGRTPLLGPQELHDLGFDLIVHPLTALLASAHAVAKAYETLRRTGSSKAIGGELLTFDVFNEIIDLDRHYALERKFREPPE